MNRVSCPWLLLLCLVFLGNPVAATAFGAEGEEGHSAEPEEAGEAGEELKNSRVGVFFGVTAAKHEPPAGTLALIASHYPTDLMGLGLEVERVSSTQSREWLIVLYTKFRWGPWTLLFGPGLELEDEEGHQTENAMLIRLGVEYGIEIPGSYEIAPALALDFMSAETKVVFGVALLKAF